MVSRNGHCNGVVGDAPNHDISSAVFQYNGHANDNVHELGHNLGKPGREHVKCEGSEKGLDPNFPYPNGKISEAMAGNNAYYGFDVSGNNPSGPIYPPDTGDLMSYCRPNWPSKYTYERMHSAIVARWGTVPAGLMMLNSNEAAVIISGVISPTQGTGQISAILQTESQQPTEAPTPGAYAIRFEDGRGIQLASYAFEPDTSSESTERPFTLLLPYDGNTRRIVLLHDSQILDERLASAHAPAVTVLSPNGGETLDGNTAIVNWEATDADGDALTYTVQYSADAGASWQTLALDWVSTTLELSLDMLPGSDQALFRVRANDGFYTGSDTSDAFFSVVRHAPMPLIQRPLEGDFFVFDQMILLEGTAYDLEDGQLTDQALSWQSNLNGELGNGRHLNVEASALAEGEHTVTLTAVDSDGQTGATQVKMKVFRERPDLPAKLSVSPSSLSFVTYVGSKIPVAGRVSLRNAGDGVITWSATTDAAWIELDKATGETPADLSFYVNPAELPVGEHQGVITLTNTGEPDSTQSVRIVLYVRPVWQIFLPIILRP